MNVLRNVSLQVSYGWQAEIQQLRFSIGKDELPAIYLSNPFETKRGTQTQRNTAENRSLNQTWAGFVADVSCLWI